MLGQTHDPLLQKLEQQTGSKVDPKYQGAFQRIVAAGLKVMYSPQSQHLMAQQLQADPNPTVTVSHGITKLMGILMREGKNTLPMQAMIPAAIVLMCEALGFLEEAGKVKVTPQLVSQCVQETMATLLQAMGVTPEKMQQIVARGQQGAQPAQGPSPAVAQQGLIAAAQGA